MLRWTPRAVLDNEEQAAAAPKQPGYSETYVVTYWETFTVDGGAVTFCVRHWPATTPWPARYELSVFCRLGASTGGLPDAAAGLRRPALLWDVDGSVPFSWTAPAPLPATEGCQQVDYARKCVVTQFVVAHGGWKLTLMWLAPSQSSSQTVPSRLAAFVQSHDGRRIVHPTHGRTFQIPILGNPELRSGPPALMEIRALAASGAGPGFELAEARRDLERQRLQQQQCEASLVEREREATELERQVSNLPAVEWLAELQGRLEEETTQRQRCQAELLDLRGRPRLFCALLPGDEAVSSSREYGLQRQSRTEVAVPSLRQSYDFDFVVELGSDAGCEPLWVEARPVLDSALRRPGSYACVFLAAPAGCGGHRHHDLLERMVDHLFECVTDISETGDFSVDATVAMTEMVSDTGSVHSLLPGATEQCVQDVSVLSLETSAEVLATHDAGLARRSHGQSHTIFSICVHRRDASTRELACAARLVVVDLAPLPEGSCGSSATVPPAGAEVTSGRSGYGRQLVMVAKNAQACVERACEVGGGRPQAAASVPLQAKNLVVACVSPRLTELEDSLPILQLAAASNALQERTSARPDDVSSRRQLAKLLQENQRLRAELSERGRVPSQADSASQKQSEAARDAEKSQPPFGRDRRAASLGGRESCGLASRHGMPWRTNAAGCLLSSK